MHPEASRPPAGGAGAAASGPAATWPLVAFPLAKLALHLAFLPGYGWFRDEFYYLACSHRLDFGYVDHPPLSILVLWALRGLLGDSLWAVRLVPALAGAATVLLVGLMARRLGGGAPAQALAMTAALAAPIYLSLHHFYSMNALDLVIWALAGYLLVRLAGDQRPALWIALGVVLGLGLQNKISVLWLGAGLLVGLLVTERRRELRNAWPWVAGALAVALFVPHLVWQVVHGWPTVEFIRNATQEKMVEVAPWDFLSSQVLVMNPVTAPLWVGGLVWLLAARAGRPFRVLGVAYLTVLAILVLSGSSRAGYLAPAYTWLFAAGGRAVEGLSRRPRLGWIPAAGVALLLLSGAAMAPLGLPILPVETYVAYAEVLGIAPSTAERKELGRLPQFYADMHGWEEIVGAVADAYHGLPAEDRERAVVFTFNYGVAGAVEGLGRPHGLPPALSGHNSYWLWGPGSATGEVVLFVGGEREELLEWFEEVEQVGVTDCGDCMPYENGNPILVARRLKAPIAEAWPGLKHFD